MNDSRFNKKNLNLTLSDYLTHTMTYRKKSTSGFIGQQEPWRLPSRQAEFDETDRLSLMRISGNDWKPRPL